MNIVIKVFYYLLVTFSNKVILFEESLKDKIPKSNKISVIPHGTQEFKNEITNEEAREKLNLPKDKKIVLIFGYLAWYKGTDWISKEFEKIKDKEEFKDFVLVIGGGPSPNHAKKDFYVEYVDYFKNLSTKNIIYTGFIDETDIPAYFTSADVVLLPYRAFMSASGPISIAYSFNKPVFVSSKISSIFKTEDLRLVLKKLRIAGEDITFDLDSQSFENLLNKMKDKEFLTKVSKISFEIAQKRKFEIIGREYLKAIYNK